MRKSICAFTNMVNSRARASRLKITGLLSEASIPRLEDQPAKADQREFRNGRMRTSERTPSNFVACRFLDSVVVDTKMELTK